MNKFILGNSIDVLTQMKENNVMVDCLLTDPPYGIQHKSNRSKKEDAITKRGIVNDGDNSLFIQKILALSYDVLKNNSHFYFFTRWDKIAEYYPMLDKYYKIKNVLIWDKMNHGSGDLTGAYANRYECIIYGMKGRRKLNEVEGKKRHQDILQFSKVSSSKLLHPHQKPVDLISFLIKKSTVENEIVLDPFGGAGTTVAAAHQTNRQSIVVELDDFYYNNGIDNLTKQKVDFERSLI